MLVVIAMVAAILASLLLPVLAKSQIAAQKKQAAKMDISQIVTAIQQYDSAYGRFPVSPSGAAGSSRERATTAIWDFHLWRRFCPENSPGPALSPPLLQPPTYSHEQLTEDNGHPHGFQPTIRIMVPFRPINTNHRENPQHTVS